MGLRILASVLAVSLLFSPLDCQVPNTDEYFLFELLQKMGLNPGKDPGFTGSFCSWRGVFCDDNAINVVKFDVSGLGLSGVIPDNTLGKLVKLESLDLSNNNISALPSDFWSLGSLKNLNVSCNQITGTLSSNIGNFGQLQSLDLSFNNLSGSIPEAISSLGGLQVVNLSYNGFQSAIPSGICQCRALVSIDLSENDLNGSLPNGFGGAFPQLKSLNLAGNHILGRDSDFSGMIKSINSLNLSGNSFEGSVVKFFEGPLKVIDLSRNQFQGIIDQVSLSSIFDPSNLLYLDLSENQLSGGFFSSLSHARNLKHINLAYNRFTEQPFFQVDMLTNLEYLNLSATDLRGEIPGNISQLTSLRTLDLSRNHLTSQIPPIVFKNIQILDLSQNNLTGEVPLVLIQEFHQMKSFNFSYNNLTYCGSQFSTEIPQSAFIGSVNTCPIAANPNYFKRKSSKNTVLKLVLALTFSMIFLLVGLLFLAFGCRRKTRTALVKQTSFKEEDEISGPFSFQTDSTIWVADVRQATSVPVVIFDKPLLNFTFADLLSATSNFDRGMLLAEGRFGPVYGGLLPGGIHVAVKVLVKGSTITDHEAARELEYLGRIKHPNLVPLAGYCLAGEQRIAIYDYMDNGNLQNLLYDLSLGVQTTEDWTSETWEDDSNDRIKNIGPQNSPNTWKFRHQIALGTARALAFLHHGCSPPIIHQDVKASNVYLDSNLEPRLSDFGLSKIFINGAEDEVARGSPGYTPPEFLQHEETCSTTKCDVYGFGVVLFQLITGKKPVEDEYPDEREGSLVSWVRGLVKKNQALRAVDPKIRGTAPDNQIAEALKIGYLCTAEIPLRRPTMQQVVGLLKDLEQIVV